MTKAELRRRLTTKVRTRFQSRDDHRHASQAICRAITQHHTFHKAKLICAFLPLPSEPGITSLWEQMGGPGFCFPRVREGSVELIQSGDRESLRDADWKLAGSGFDLAPVVPPEAVDLFLVPGLAFTPDGRRLGRGGGYYDRLLARRAIGSTAIGICFAVQLLESLPTEPHDQRVDAVITEHGITAATD